MAIEELHWLLPGRLAGSAQPGLIGDLTEDLAELARLGIRLVVSLTEVPLALAPERFGMRGLHFPICDMGVPTPRATAAVCRTIAESLSRGEPVLLHCKAGLGRTGTVLACCLVARGQTAEAATTTVRRVCRRYVQTELQEAFVDHFAEHWRETSEPAATAVGSVEEGR